MWNGDSTTEDCKRINSRVVGYNGLELPSYIEDGFSKRNIQNWKNTPKYSAALINVFIAKIKFMSKETFVMPAQRTKIGMLSRQQYFKSTYMQHTHQYQAIKSLLTIHLLSNQISQVLSQRTLTKSRQTFTSSNYYKLWGCKCNDWH